ncbi:MAG: adenosylcobinamide-GDP ribazoletransferase [Polyangiales bacterium]
MLRALACAITFLTRVPLPAFHADPRDVARSPGWFAAVGLLIGAPLWAVAAVTEAYLGARIAALSTVALWVALTGGLHLDGVADMADGFSGGRGDRDRTLAIMRDSRIGAHGAVALILVLGLKWALLEPSIGRGASWWLMAPVAARFGCTVLMATLPYARPEGLGAMYAGMPRARVLALGAATVIAVAMWLDWAAWSGRPLMGALLGWGIALLLALRARRLLGGLTGDVYGAAIELSELGCLVGVAWSALR